MRRETYVPQYVTPLDIGHRLTVYLDRNVLFPDGKTEKLQKIWFEWVGHDVNEPSAPWIIHANKQAGSVPVYVKCLVTSNTQTHASWLVHSDGQVEYQPHNPSGKGGYPVPHTLNVQLSGEYCINDDSKVIHVTGVNRGTNDSFTGLSWIERIKYCSNNEIYKILFGPTSQYNELAMPSYTPGYDRRIGSVYVDNCGEQWNDTYRGCEVADTEHVDAFSIGALLHSKFAHETELWKFREQAHDVMDCYATGAYEEICCPQDDLWYEWMSSHTIWDIGIGMDYAVETAIRSSDGDALIDVLHLFPHGKGSHPVSKLPVGTYLVERICVHKISRNVRKPGDTKTTIMVWSGAQNSLIDICAAHLAREIE